jgi:hypothetical protein
LVCVHIAPASTWGPQSPGNVRGVSPHDRPTVLPAPWIVSIAPASTWGTHSKENYSGVSPETRPTFLPGPWGAPHSFRHRHVDHAASSKGNVPGMSPEARPTGLRREGGGGEPREGGRPSFGVHTTRFKMWFESHDGCPSHTSRVRGLTSDRDLTSTSPRWASLLAHALCLYSGDFGFSFCRSIVLHTS